MNSKKINWIECPPKLVDGWIDRGRQEDDVLFKFVSFWIAMNQLYNLHGDENESEISRIKEFARNKHRIIDDNVDYQAGYMKIFKERPILGWFDTTDRYDWREGPDFVAERIMNRFQHRSDRQYLETNCRDAANNYVRICDPRCRSKDKAEALLMSIYRVRCNLFHGGKNPEEERNYNLIESSVQILELILPGLRDDMYR